MTADSVVHISAHDNPLVKELRRLAHDGAAYRRSGRVWIEGDHLCRAALVRGRTPDVAVFSAGSWAAGGAGWATQAPRTVVLADALFDEISALESPSRMGFVLALPQAAAPAAGVPSVVLDRVQDAGNVGSILRSAAAFGFRQIVALKGTAALWSPKVLRAGMGAHFALALVEGAEPEALAALALPLVVTSSHHGELLQRAALPWPCAWVMGHEGQGVRDSLMQSARLAVRIAQPGGEESLNVAAAAAICLHASAVGAAQKP